MLFKVKHDVNIYGNIALLPKDKKIKTVNLNFFIRLLKPSYIDIFRFNLDKVNLNNIYFNIKILNNITFKLSIDDYKNIDKLQSFLFINSNYIESVKYNYDLF
jgi:hypothetical protein